MADKLFAIFMLIFVLFSYNPASAYLGTGFGGKVTGLDASTETIRQAQADGSKCSYNGNVIEVAPGNGSTGQRLAFFIPSFVDSVSDHSLRSTQWILGLFYRRSPIRCEKAGNPPTVKYIYLNTINLFGTSR